LPGQRLEGDGTGRTDTGGDLRIDELLIGRGRRRRKEHPVRTAGLRHRKARHHPGQVLENQHRVIDAQRAVAADITGALLHRRERAHTEEHLQHIHGVEDADRTTRVTELLRLHLPRILRQADEGEVPGVVGGAGRRCRTEERDRRATHGCAAAVVANVSVDAARLRRGAKRSNGEHKNDDAAATPTQYVVGFPAPQRLLHPSSGTRTEASNIKAKRSPWPPMAGGQPGSWKVAGAALRLPPTPPAAQRACRRDVRARRHAVRRQRTPR